MKLIKCLISVGINQIGKSHLFDAETLFCKPFLFIWCPEQHISKHPLVTNGYIFRYYVITLLRYYYCYSSHIRTQLPFADALTQSSNNPSLTGGQSWRSRAPPPGPWRAEGWLPEGGYYWSALDMVLIPDQLGVWGERPPTSQDTQPRSANQRSLTQTHACLPGWLMVHHNGVCGSPDQWESIAGRVFGGGVRGDRADRSYWVREINLEAYWIWCHFPFSWTPSIN